MIVTIVDFFFGGKDDRLSKAIKKFEDRIEKAAGIGNGSAEQQSQTLAAYYVRVLRLAKRIDVNKGTELIKKHHLVFSENSRNVVFNTACKNFLTIGANEKPIDQCRFCFELARRENWTDVIHSSSKILISNEIQTCDTNRLVNLLVDLQQSSQLTEEVSKNSIESYFKRNELKKSTRMIWESFIGSLAPSFIPEIFETELLTGRIAAAEKLASSREQRLYLLSDCRFSETLEHLNVALRIAQFLGDTAVQKDLHFRLAERLLAHGEPDQALTHAIESADSNLKSLCHEQQKNFSEAMYECPSEDAIRFQRLAKLSMEQIDEFVSLDEFASAARLLEERSARFNQGQFPQHITDFLESTHCDQRLAMLKQGRLFFRAKISEHPDHTTEWLEESAEFELCAGQITEASSLFVKAGNSEKAKTVLRSAGRYGELIAILESEEAESFPDEAALLDKAELLRLGGDFKESAEIMQSLGRLKDAAERFEESEDWEDAIKCLDQCCDADLLAVDGKYQALMIKAGCHEELLRRLLTEFEKIDRDKNPSSSSVFEQLARWESDSEFMKNVSQGMGESLSKRIEMCLDQAMEGIASRTKFLREKVSNEIKGRFSKAWGMDLGTSTSAVAIYDIENSKVVMCPSGGKDFFPSTFAIDMNGNSVVGLEPQELINPNFSGTVRHAKRDLGSRLTYRVANKDWKPVEILSRIVSHGRGLAETLLSNEAAILFTKMSELEGLEIPPMILEKALELDPFTFDLKDCVITVPAYYRNNQKAATRDLADITQVNLYRLIHEPTAACVSASHERNIGDTRLLVVDLGAGTLDLSLVETFYEAGKRVCEVLAVGGDASFGGADFDEQISKKLCERIEIEHAMEIGRDSIEYQRIQLVAESLKIRLSSSESAEETLHGFGELDALNLRLSRDELIDFTQPLLTKLSKICTDFRNDHAKEFETCNKAILVGAPTLAPFIASAITGAFDVNSIQTQDPRLLVSKGAAIYAAVLAGDLTDSLILDVIPVGIGIACCKSDSRIPEYDELIIANSTIPCAKSREYLALEENQASVEIVIYQGSLDLKAKIASFNLNGIKSAAGENKPRISISFEVDENCTLSVIAKDEATGNVESLLLKDATLLAPQQRKELKEAFQRERLDASLRQRRVDEGNRLRSLVDQASQIKPMVLFDAWLKERDALTMGLLPKEELKYTQDFTEMFNCDVEQMRTEFKNNSTILADSISRSKGVLEEVFKQGKTIELSAYIGGLASVIDSYAKKSERIKKWVAIIRVFAEHDPNPVKRFWNAFRQDQWSIAIEEFSQINPDNRCKDIIQSQLECLAQKKQFGEYKELFLECRESLEIMAPQGLSLEDWLDQIKPTIAWIRCETVGSGSGFLIASNMVATNRHVVVYDEERMVKPVEASKIRVHISGEWRSVKKVHLDAGGPQDTGDVAILELDIELEIAPLRLGFGPMIRLAQNVRGVGFPLPDGNRDFEENLEFQSGLINKRQVATDSASGLLWLKIGFLVGPGMSGGPVINDLGEVVGIITMIKTYGANLGQESWALSADPLRALFRKVCQDVSDQQEINNPREVPI